ncbi:hypothetical protein Hanom_Chr05g00436351 [Helianthus anomalus]
MSEKWPETSEEVPVLKFNSEGAQLPKPRPLRGVTSAGKEILFLSSEESERPKKAPKKKASKKVTVDTGTTSKKGGSSRATAATTEKSIPRVRQSNLEDYVIRLREETAAGSKLAQKVVRPVIGKQSSLRSLYKFSTPAGDVIPEKETTETEAAATTKHVEAQGPEVVRITGLDQPLKRKEAEVIKPKETKPAPKYTSDAVASAGAGGPGAAGSAGAAGQKGAWGTGSMPRAPIGAEDTLGDIYYKTYTEEQRGDTPHQPVWSLKQKDTFVKFGACRDWYLSSLPPEEVNRQIARTHEGLYRVYIVGEANARSANHQIVRKWRTMCKERTSWEKYREHLLKEVQAFEQMKNTFAGEKAAFEAEKKAEEWGREGLKNKLQAAEELLSKERAEWKKIREKDNQRMYTARSKLPTSRLKSPLLRGRLRKLKRIKIAKLNARMVNKDKDLAAKDVEIVELKRRLFEAHDKNESLEIDLKAERVKAETAEEAKKKAEEARDISTSALNMA